jgi:hypothetical protein
MNLNRDYSLLSVDEKQQLKNEIKRLKSLRNRAFVYVVRKNETEKIEVSFDRRHLTKNYIIPKGDPSYMPSYMREIVKYIDGQKKILVSGVNNMTSKVNLRKQRNRKKKQVKMCQV